MLDVGTGPGFAAAAATQALGGRGLVVGLDLSLRMLRLASHHGVTSLVCAQAPRLPFRDATFDAVVACLGRLGRYREAEAARDLADLYRAWRKPGEARRWSGR